MHNIYHIPYIIVKKHRDKLREKRLKYGKFKKYDDMVINFLER